LAVTLERDWLSPQGTQRLEVPEDERQEGIELGEEQEDDENRVPLIEVARTGDAVPCLCRAPVSVAQRAEHGDRHQRQGRRSAECDQDQRDENQRG
jgi:hypothetical protein